MSRRRFFTRSAITPPNMPRKKPGRDCPSATAAKMMAPITIFCTAAGGWYYDNPASPTKIILCPATCDEVKTFNEASIEIVLGCATVVS